MANSSNDRIVVLIDMDCFFCQVETKLHPEYAGKPLAVVQYTQWQRGGIIAVNYEAREFGVTRHMRGEEAKEKCPDIVLASVPCLRAKADTSRYRSAGREVIDVIRKHCNIVERASVDEAYLDITDIIDKRMSKNLIPLDQLTAKLSNTFVVGYSEVGKNDEEERNIGTATWIKNVFDEFEDVQAQKLAIAGVIVDELRADIFDKTGFRCSAGIAQNKILAKLACGLHKPNRQTILPPSAVPKLYSTLPIKKVRNLGGKFGDVIIESLNCNVMGDLLQYSLKYLQKRFDDKTGLWLYNIARGIDNEPVTIRLVSKSIGACKKFPGKQAITSLDVLKHWAGELSAEVCERLEQDLEENERRATLATVCFHYYQNKAIVSQSRSYTLNSYKAEKMAIHCVEIISKSTQCPIAYLGISAGKFITAKGSGSFQNFFKSSKLQQCTKPNACTNNTKADTAHSVKDTAEVNQLVLNKSIETDSNTGDLNIITSELKNCQKPKSNVQLNEQIPNVKTDWSPTSRRLSKLINSLNERNKKNALCESKTNCNLNDSLNQSDFKESFFMNVFNPTESKLESNHSYNIELIELNDNKNFNIVNESTNLNKDTISKDDASNCDKVLVLTDEEWHNGEVTNNQIEPRPTCSSTNANQEGSANTLLCTVKLKDIFPDFNNIDPDVVALLPLELREEAKLYMKIQNKSDNTKEVLMKTSKGKNKSKMSTSRRKKDTDISNFLVKRNFTSDSVEIPTKQCSQCYQMIPLLRYQEHSDYHVAHSLQRELNSPELQSGNMKRKIGTDGDGNSVKRRPNNLTNLRIDNSDCNLPL